MYRIFRIPTPLVLITVSIIPRSSVPAIGYVILQASPESFKLAHRLVDGRALKSHNRKRRLGKDDRSEKVSMLRTHHQKSTRISGTKNDDSFRRCSTFVGREELPNMKEPENLGISFFWRIYRLHVSLQASASTFSPLGVQQCRCLVIECRMTD